MRDLRKIPLLVLRFAFLEGFLAVFENLRLIDSPVVLCDEISGFHFKLERPLIRLPTAVSASPLATLPMRFPLASMISLFLVP